MSRLFVSTSGVSYASFRRRSNPLHRADEQRSAPLRRAAATTTAKSRYVEPHRPQETPFWRVLVVVLPPAPTRKMLRGTGYALGVATRPLSSLLPIMPIVLALCALWRIPFALGYMVGRPFAIRRRIVSH